MEQRGVKRSGPLLNTDLSKRRAPYALRACTACRRRKGKCNGQQPCDHCDSRGQLCAYENEAGVSRYLGQRDKDHGRLGQAQDQAQPVSRRQAQKQVPRNRELSPPSLPTAMSDGTTLLSNSITNTRTSAGTVAVARHQLKDVEPMIEVADKTHTSNGSKASEELISIEERRSGNRSAGMSNRLEQESQHAPESNRLSQTFCGPTSPNYSMNLVQIKLRELGYLTTLHRRPMLPSLEEDDATSPTSHWQTARHCDRHHLLQFRSWLTIQDAKAVLSTYQETVGVLHPFVDSGLIEKQLDAWYSYNPNQPAGGHDQPEDDDLLILVLVLAIAAQAQVDTVHAKMASVMHSSFQHAANATTTSATGYYYFSYDLPRLALRMCGTAGRILLELGFHNGDMLDQVLQSEAQRKTACIIMSSVIILDRQWSAMSGLPANFPNATFNPTPAYLTDAPYTHAMYKLVLIGDRFNEPITLAARGNSYIDDDTIEVLMFQIQQWEKKSVGEQTLDDMDSWSSEPSSIPPSWALLVIFRAASIRSLLLRPYFFPTTHIQRSKQHILPALELASQVTRALVSLDSTTNIYRNQRSYCQHALASICALMFLIAGYVKEHREAVSQYLPPDYEEQIRHYFQLAKGLTEKYSGVSKAASSLCRRIRELCHAMESHGSQRTADDRGLSSSSDPKTSRISVDTPSTHQQAQFPTPTEAYGDTETAVENTPFQFDPWSFGATLDMDFPIDGNGDMLQKAQAWGLPGWPSNLQSYLFR
ncbi:uncharacterized protein CTRU02_210614 [Colletotrichum truncatum]|uniref:Uncharacterized protein n=1 Tax=Colletotrichum truncatum TaxID=5467 RepID=A0ACC3YPI9_COLTU